MFNYDANNRLIEKRIPLEKDSSGNVIYAIESYSYDKAGNLLRHAVTSSIDKTFIRETVNTYYDNNLIHTATDNSGAYTIYHYDSNGNKIKVEQMREAGLFDITKYSYDNMNRLIEQSRLVDESDIETAGIDNMDELQDEEYAGKIRIITGFDYDILGNQTRKIESRAYASALSDLTSRDKYTVIYNYDALNRLETMVRKFDGNDVFIRYTYDEVGNKIADRNERGFITTYGYDAVNRLISVTDPKQNTFTYTYDKSGNKVSEKSAAGHTMTYTFDKLNRLVTIADPYSIIIQKNLYDPNGNLVKRMDAKGILAASTDEDRYVSLFTYDLANRLVKTIDAELASENDPNKFTRAFRYNPVGELVKEIDAIGHATTYAYDNAGRLIKVTDALGNSTTYIYDKAGNKLFMIDGRGKVTQYVYGAFGLLKRVTNANNKSVEYRYNLALHVALMIDRKGNHTRYAYDNRNLLLHKSVDETGDAISYGYDAVGNRISMNDESGASSYAYDDNNRLLNIAKDGMMEISYTYDTIGNIAAVEDKTGFKTTYTYDKSSRLETVTFNGKTTTYTYDENGNRASVVYDGGVQETYSYDRNNNLLSLTNEKPNGDVISAYGYTYDDAGRQVTKTDSFGTTDYTYDEVGRVTKVEAPGKTTLYTYDRAGNRQSLHETYTSLQPSGYVDTISGSEVNYSIKKTEYLYSNANELLRLVETMFDAEGVQLLEKTTTYLYDANGNEIRQKVSYLRPHAASMRQVTGGNLTGDTIDDEIHILLEKVSSTYDGFNRLQSMDKIKNGSRTTVEFVYNGDGLRTRKTVRSSETGYAEEVTNYFYDRQHVILETDASDKVSVRYVRGINYIARIDASNKASYYLFNGHGDVVQTVSETGQIENQYDYDIFGNPILTIETEYKNAIRYAGEFYDGETGLYYLRARYYNPYTGRFISEDSYWGEDNKPLSLNRYTYAHNNPIMFVDPTGHFAAMIGAIFGKVVGASNFKIIDEKTYLVNKIKEQGAIWKAEEQTNGKNKSEWTQAQVDANKKANDLRARLAVLEKGSEEVASLVKNEEKNKDSSGKIVSISSVQNNSLNPTSNKHTSEKVILSEQREDARPSWYLEGQGQREVGLSAYATSLGGQVSWDEKTKTASVTLNGVTRRFNINDFNVVDGRIQIDPKQFENAFNSRVTFFQHGVNANSNTFKEMTNELSKIDNDYIDLGVITNKGLYLNDIKKEFHELLDNLGIDFTSKDPIVDPRRLVDKLLSMGKNVLFRTEFSNPTGGHFEQISELSSYIDLVTNGDEKVNLVGHSKGGLVSVGYTGYIPSKVNKVITVDTPYLPNEFAKISVNLIDNRLEAYHQAASEYEDANWFTRMNKYKKLETSRVLLEKALQLGTMGTQDDYNKIQGLRDLAGQTNALKTIRDHWNTQYDDGNLQSVQAFAIATDSWDAETAAYKTKSSGDMIVSTESQRGAGFNGITSFTFTVPDGGGEKY